MLYSDKILVEKQIEPLIETLIQGKKPYALREKIFIIKEKATGNFWCFLVYQEHAAALMIPLSFCLHQIVSW